MVVYYQICVYVTNLLQMDLINISING